MGEAVITRVPDTCLCEANADVSIPILEQLEPLQHSLGIGLNFIDENTNFREVRHQIKAR